METYELVIKSGRILDPASRFEGVLNIGIRNGKLATLSTEELEGKQVIDASGLTVSPGFIDIHAHPDGQQKDGVNLALQGVTTALGGNCGSLLCISSEEYSKLLLETSGETYDLIQYKRDLGTFLEEMDAQGYPINVGMLAGAWFLRLKVGANDKNKPATHEQVEKLAALAEEAMQQGAFGVSFGLAYAPGTSKEELEVLFDVAARHDGIAGVHQRYSGVEVPGFTKDAITGEIELIEAARKTGCKLQISHIGHHISYASTPYDRFFLRGLEVIEQARAEGVDVMADSFPFAGAGSVISDEMMDMVFSPQFRKIMGMDVAEYAVLPQGPHKGEKLTAQLFATLRREAHNTPVTFRRLVLDDLVLRSILPPWVMVCSDTGLGWVRASQPVVLGRMVRELAMLSWMEALEKMTILPARRLGLKNKGRIMAGADADLVIFDAGRIGGNPNDTTLYSVDNAEGSTPEESVEGISRVIVNGVVVVKDGVYQEVKPGKALRHQPWQ